MTVETASLHKQSSANRLTVLMGAVITWAAVIVQFILMLENRTAAVPETIVRFFSFFTILTNAWVAICFTNLLISDARRHFSAKVLTATAVYILVVGLVYNTVLRGLWQPQGLQRIVDEALHTIVPLLYVIYWWFHVRRHRLAWRDVFSWLLYPFLYLVFILIRGNLSGFYPYPFVNVIELGYPRIALNAGILLVVFLGLNLLAVWLTRKGKALTSF